MERDAFSRYHPAVNFIWFAGAIGFGVVLQHPAYLLAALCCSSFWLRGRGKLPVESCREQSIPPRASHAICMRSPPGSAYSPQQVRFPGKTLENPDKYGIMAAWRCNYEELSLF